MSISLITTTFIISIINTALAGFIWARYGHRREGRSYVVLAATQILIAMMSMLRRSVSNPAAFAPLTALNFALLALLPLTLLLFLTALYAPDWWRDRRVLPLVGLPYVVMALLLMFDLLFGWRIFLGEIEGVGIAMRVPFGPLGPVAASLYVLAWLPPVYVLISTMRRRPDQRRPIAVMLIAIVVGAMSGMSRQFLPVLQLFSTVIIQTLLPSALFYLILSRRIFETTRIGLERAMLSIGDGVAVLSRESLVMFSNPPAAELIGQIDQPAQGPLGPQLAPLLAAEHREGVLTTDDGRSFNADLTPIFDEEQRLRGYLLVLRDVTERLRAERELYRRQAELEHALAELREVQRSEQQLSQTVLQLSQPIIPVAQGVIIVPLVGALDADRAAELIDPLLQGIQRLGAHTVLLDLTGVPLIDDRAAAALLSAVRAAALLGARTILAGINPEIAQSLVAQDVDLRSITTAPTLQQALAALTPTLSTSRVERESVPQPSPRG